jgi:hypothetical protein
MTTTVRRSTLSEDVRDLVTRTMAVPSHRARDVPDGHDPLRDHTRLLDGEEIKRTAGALQALA